MIKEQKGKVEKAKKEANNAKQALDRKAGEIKKLSERLISSTSKFDDLEKALDAAQNAKDIKKEVGEEERGNIENEVRGRLTASPSAPPHPRLRSRRSSRRSPSSSRSSRSSRATMTRRLPFSPLRRRSLLVSPLPPRQEAPKKQEAPKVPPALPTSSTSFPQAEAPKNDKAAPAPAAKGTAKVEHVRNARLLLTA
eukprot:746943-Hanusia_phi.AAC.1